MDSHKTPDKGSLNEFQARRLRVTCQHIDNQLGEIEEILHATGSKAAFPRFLPDVAPAQHRTIEDYIARLRAQLVRVLDGQAIAREKPSIPVSRAIHAALVSIDIVVEELDPHYMRGYGDVSEPAAIELNGIVGELRGLVSKLNRYLVEGIGQDLKERLQRLEQKSNDLDLLSRIEQIVADRGLVEFRATIASILDRAEDKAFEIAVFGRVSSGKSSLLNAILDADILPVGVTPITAVPTRIAYGPKPYMTVSFAEAPAKTVEISRLAEFATEQQNSGNTKRVTRIVVTLPAARLRDGVTFMDTPGLGSLATSGAAETLSYLPKCDLGVVLIDAGATLTAEDLQTILALQEAVIPVHVLLSKADLLNAEDCEKIIQYVREHITSECNLELPVHPVSVLSTHRTLLDRWFDEQIVPLYGRSQELREASLRRKIGALRESLLSTLNLQLQRNRISSPDAQSQVRTTEARLRRATGLIEKTWSGWEKEIEGMAGQLSEAFSEMAANLMEAWSGNPSFASSPDKIARDSVLQFVQRRVKKLQDSLETLTLQLRDDLRTCASDLGVADVPGQDEFQSLIRGTPVFDPGAISASVSRPTVAAMFGKRFATRRLASRLREQLENSIYQALDIYSAMLKEWTRSVASQVGRKFETYAERYRAQAERSLGGKGLTADEVSAIQESLRLLGAPQANSYAENAPGRTPQDETEPIAGEIVGHAPQRKPR